MFWFVFGGLVGFVDLVDYLVGEVGVMIVYFYE